MCDETTGLSKASMHCNVHNSGNGRWTFDHWMCCPHNGEGGFGTVSWGVHNGTQWFAPFTLGPCDIHEGGFESINVVVCAAASASAAAAADDDEDDIHPPLAARCHQHEWSEINDCTQSQCAFCMDVFHPGATPQQSRHALTFGQLVC